MQNKIYSIIEIPVHTITTRTITYMYQNKFIVRPYGIKIHRFILSE